MIMTEQEFINKWTANLVKLMQENEQLRVQAKYWAEQFVIAKQTRQEPSRLEIAAICLSGAYGSYGKFEDLAKAALKQADALIAAAAE
jgi:hypothetical protein